MLHPAKCCASCETLRCTDIAVRRANLQSATIIFITPIVTVYAFNHGISKRHSTKRRNETNCIEIISHISPMWAWCLTLQKLKNNNIACSYLVYTNEVGTNNVVHLYLVCTLSVQTRCKWAILLIFNFCKVERAKFTSVHAPSEDNAITIINDDPRRTKFRFVKRFEGDFASSVRPISSPSLKVHQVSLRECFSGLPAGNEGTKRDGQKRFIRSLVT